MKNGPLNRLFKTQFVPLTHTQQTVNIDCYICMLLNRNEMMSGLEIKLTGNARRSFK